MGTRGNVSSGEMSMQIQITQVASEAGTTVVCFRAACGNAKVAWAGGAVAAGDRRWVELSVGTALEVGASLVETAEPPGLRIEANTTLVIGEIVEVDADGCVRMETGCGVVDLEVTGTLPELHGRYRFETKALQAFDCNY
jgi:hypothetical protein